MTTKIKTTLLTAFLFFGLLTGLQAQDKYEFALIHFTTSAYYISYSSGQVEEFKINKGEQTDNNQTLVMKKVEELNSKGWELVAFDSYPTSYVLRRKKS